MHKFSIAALGYQWSGDNHKGDLVEGQFNNEVSNAFSFEVYVEIETTLYYHTE